MNDLYLKKKKKKRRLLKPTQSKISRPGLPDFSNDLFLQNPLCSDKIMLALLKI